jgi:hypothetical protein
MADASSKGILKGHSMPGSSHPMSKLSVGQVLDIRKRHAAGERRKSIAADFGIALNTVSDIGRRRGWRHI